MNYSNKNLKDFYNKNGFLIIKNFFSKKLTLNLQKEIFLVSKNLYKYHFTDFINVPFEVNNFDYYIDKAFKNKKKNFVSSFYNAAKKFNSIYNITFFNKSLKLANILLNSKNTGTLIRACGIRMDYPQDKVHLTQLHQDYIQNLGSPNGLVFYSSLKKVTKLNGPVMIYPGSQKIGISKVKLDNKTPTKSRSYELDISSKKLNSYKKKPLYIDPSDLAIFDFLLLHKSSYNQSSSIRWSMVSRYFDFNSEIGKKNMFIGGLQENIFFENIHPEYIKL